MNIHTEKDLGKLQKIAGERISEHLSQNNGPVLLLIAGGSAFSILDFIDVSALSNRVTIHLSDERFYADEKNNFVQFQKTQFYKRAVLRNVACVDSQVLPKETFPNYHSRFERQIKKWMTENKDGKIIATFGIGPDGHTSGIMPFPENPTLFKQLFQEEEITVGYSAEGKNEFALRVTTTLTFVQKYVQVGIVYCVGSNKIPALRAVVSERGSLTITPARVLNEIKILDLFTDQEIA